MRTLLRLLAVGSVIAVAGCGGSTTKPSQMTTSTSAPTTTVAATTTVPALTVANVAVSLSNTMNTTFIAAMRAGSLPASIGSTRHGAGWLALLRFLLPQPLFAQASPFQAPCPRGGNVTVRYGGARAREYNLQSVPVVYSRCGSSAGPRAFTFDFNGNANGRWTADAPESPVRMTGTGMIDEIVGPVPIDCETSRTNCNGTVGGVMVGPMDTAPPVNPTTTTTSTIPQATTVPATTVPATTIPALNISGNWTVTSTSASGSGTMTLTQTGTSITGAAVIPPVAGATILTNRVTGSISGSTVNLAHALSISVAAGGSTTTCTGTTNYVLQATSTRMTGTFSDTTACTHNIPGVPQVPPMTTNGNATFTKQ